MTSLPAWAEAIVGLSVILGALAATKRYVWPIPKRLVLGAWNLMRGLVRLVEGTQRFLAQWHGTDDAPGIPERLGTIEVELRKTNGGSTVRDLARMGYEGVTRLEQAVAELSEKQDAQGARITEHRRRNDDQALLLRQELQARNAEVDQRLDHLSDDLMRAEVYRASLVEIGMDIPPPDEEERR